MVKSEALKKKEIKKHVAAIQCSNTLTLLQRKISNALLFHAYTQLKTVEEHHITIKQLCHFIGYNGNNHSVIKEAIKGLIATVIEWDIFEDVTGEEDWTASSILASVSIKGPNCYYAYSPRMRDLLHSPSIFAKINLIVQANFKSNYGLALYENCIRYQNLPQTKWFEFEKFRKLMGVGRDVYPMFRDFKRRVLDKAVEEVNTYADLFVQPEIEKSGWKVIRIRFKLSVREKKKWLGVNLGQKGRVEQPPHEDSLRKEVNQLLLQEFCLDIKKATQILKEYETEYVYHKIKLIKNSTSYKSGYIQNMAGYLLNLLKNDYKYITHAELKENNRKIAFEKEIYANRQKEKEEQIEREYRIYVINEYFKTFEKLSEAEKADFIIDLENTLKSEKEAFILWERYKKFGLKSGLIMPYFKKMMFERYPEFLSYIVSLNIFRENYALRDRDAV